MSTKAIFNQAVKMTNHAMSESDVAHIIRETMDSIQDSEHWKNPSHYFTHNRSEAVRSVAAFIFFHGGVEILESRRDNKKIYIVSSKGYNHYMGA